MPLIKPTFVIPGNIPYISGQYGPFINTNLTSSQKRGLFMLIFFSLTIIIGFAAAAYKYQTSDRTYSSKNNGEACQPEDPIADKGSIGYFLNANADMSSFLIGMSAGIVFGLIDNMGLWYGMDALDPVVNPEKVPWVYGQGGGKRYFTGLDLDGKVVYKGVKFKDGKMSAKELKAFKKIAEKINDQYTGELRYSDEKREGILTNESAFANPSSGMFLGQDYTKREFINLFKQRKINEKLYFKKIDYYRDFRNGKVDRKLKLKSDLLAKEISRRKGFTGLGTGLKLKELERKYYQTKPWPGTDKSLADAALSGWSPGKLTQSGIGNTFSDALGGFVSTFIAVMIVHATGQCTNSLISEVLGLIIGCLLGIFIPRLPITPSTLT